MVLDRVKSTTQAPRELELNSNTCAAWVRKAGLKGRGKPGTGLHPGRDKFFRLRQTGLNRRKAAAAVGTHLRTAQEWDQGIRKSGGCHIYPEDGRMNDYKSGVTTVPPAPSEQCWSGRSRWPHWRNLSVPGSSACRSGS